MIIVCRRCKVNCSVLVSEWHFAILVFLRRSKKGYSITDAAVFRQASACLETCVFNRVGFMKSGGKEMDEEKFKAKITKSVTVPWSEVASSAADTCFSQMKDMKMPEGGSCSEQPIAFAHCFRRQLFLNCPKEMWAGSNDCNLIKQQMENCPMLPPPPPGHPDNPDFRPL